MKQLETDRTSQRRRFLLGLLSFFTASRISVESEGQARPETATRVSPLYVYAAENGATIGILFAGDVERHNAHLKTMRRKHKCQLPLRSKSTNKYQLPYALYVLEYFFKEPDLSFAIHIPVHSRRAPSAEKEREGKSNLNDRQRTRLVALNMIQAGLGVRRRGTISGRNLYLDISSPGRDDRKDLKTQLVARLPGATYRQAQRSELAQMASFLTGTTNAFAGLVNRESPSKVLVRDALQEKLRVTPTRIDLLIGNRKFRLAR